VWTEKLGFEESCITGHHFIEYGLSLDPAALASAAASQTRRIRIGLADAARGGALAGGRVANVAVETSRQMLVSTIMRLCLEVEGQAEAAPLRVFYKTRRPDSAVTAEAVGRAEVDFPWIWWYNFERIMEAVEDLDCLDFLD
jgi:luciferase-like monooxygenase